MPALGRGCWDRKADPARAAVFGEGQCERYQEGVRREGGDVTQRCQTVCVSTETWPHGLALSLLTGLKPSSFIWL